MKKIILASKSPRRKEILEKIGLNFEVVGNNYEENFNIKGTPSQIVKKMSLGKAKSISKIYNNHIIISADTLVLLGNQFLGKPNNKENAIQMLKKINGKKLYVISGLTIVDTNKNIIKSKSVKTKVYFNELSEKEIIKYVESGEPLDKAGGFGIQGIGGIFIKKIEGDYFNVVGLPVNLLYKMLKDFEIDILENKNEFNN